MYLTDATGSNHRGPCPQCKGGLLHVLLPEVREAREANGIATPDDDRVRCDQCDYLAPRCATCRDEGSVCLSYGGDPDRTYDVPCPECSEPEEEDPRTEAEIRAEQTYRDREGSEL